MTLLQTKALTRQNNGTRNLHAAVEIAWPETFPAAQTMGLVRLAVTQEHPVAQHDGIRDRAVGALVGLAVGDAVGTALEFKSRDSYEHITNMVGGGPFHLNAGEWTDDTSMALALAHSLVARPELDPDDLMQGFLRWRDNGEFSCGCPDIGSTVAAALERYGVTGDPYAGSTEAMSAGNGSLMRLAPVALAYWNDRDRLVDVAARQSRTTHGATEAVDACIAFACVLADAISGKQRFEVLAARPNTYCPVINSIMMGGWRGKDRDQICSSAYVAHSLEAALWCVDQTNDFRSGVLLAANLGEDADTTAAITGQLAGALYGMSGIPSLWLAKLAWRSQIELLALALLDTRSEHCSV